LLFLIDAQLPPRLAVALRDAGQGAIHVSDIGMTAATDLQIWNEAVVRSAVLVSKDRDFSILRATTVAGPAILWVRVGNTDNKKLIEQFVQALPKIIGAITRGEKVIEFAG